MIYYPVGDPLLSCIVVYRKSIMALRVAGGQIGFIQMGSSVTPGLIGHVIQEVRIRGHFLRRLSC
jgi:hypothetical protein